MVHILATVRKPELLPAATLVFATLRVGFPTADICVWGNGLDPEASRHLASAAQFVGGAFANLPPSSHDAWIEGILLRSTAPFWICDTDMVFHSSVESFVLPTECAFAGRFEPEFLEEWTDTVHVARLHTCLQWLAPERVRSQMHGYIATFPQPWRNTAQFPFVRQHFVPVRGERAWFYDSTAGLYQAGIGTPFTAAQNDAFDHLCFATYIDAIAPHLKDIAPGIEQRFAAIYRDPSLARGIRHEQEKYYAARSLRQPQDLPCPTPTA